MDEKYLQGKITTDFIEYRQDKFLVTCNEDKYIYLIDRADTGIFSGGSLTKIHSMNGNYISQGISLMPGFEDTFAMIRDRRGIQYVNLKKRTTHQLILSEVPVSYSNNSFLQILYDPEKHTYGFATIYYGPLTDKQKENLDEASLASVSDGKTDKPLLAMYQFNSDFYAGLLSLTENCTAERILY